MKYKRLPAPSTYRTHGALIGTDLDDSSPLCLGRPWLGSVVVPGTDRLSHGRGVLSGGKEMCSRSRNTDTIEKIFPQMIRTAQHCCYLQQRPLETCTPRRIAGRENIKMNLKRLALFG